MIALGRHTHDKCQETDGNPMTAHRAASPVKTEVISVGHEWLLSAEEPAGMRYTSPLRPPVPLLDELADIPALRDLRTATRCRRRSRPGATSPAPSSATGVSWTWLTWLASWFPNW